MLYNGEKENNADTAGNDEESKRSTFHIVACPLLQMM
jgi:hypothetical protein